MLKFGICTLAQLDRTSPAMLAETRRYFRRFCDITLYEALAQRGNPGDEALQAAVLDLFPIANRAFKRTSSRRFEDFDRQVMARLEGILRDSRTVVVHDMAVSDGRTACEFYRALEKRFGTALEFVASDLCVRVSALSRRGSALTVVIDEDGVPLQLIRPPFVLPLAITESWLYPVNRLLRKALLTEVRAVMADARNGEAGIERREILLLCSAARSLLVSSGSFRVERHDIFHAASRRYQVMRAMNVFNPTYFSTAQLALGIAKVGESLEEDGLFIVGSNGETGSVVDGGLYRKRDGRFVEVFRCGTGPAIAPLLFAPGSARSGAQAVGRAQEIGTEQPQAVS